MKLLLVIFIFIFSSTSFAQSEFEYFSPVFGLVTTVDPGTENGGSFLAQYNASLKDLKGFLIYIEKMQRAVDENAFYKRSENHTERSVSHDEITGMMASSYIFNTPHRFAIWNRLSNNLGAYPAVVKDWSDFLPYNPGNYYPWGQYVDSEASYIFLPIYFANMLIAISKDKQETSSKLLYWLELKTMPSSTINDALKKFFESKNEKTIRRQLSF